MFGTSYSRMRVDSSYNAVQYSMPATFETSHRVDEDNCVVASLAHGNIRSISMAFENYVRECHTAWMFGPSTVMPANGNYVS